MNTGGYFRSLEAGDVHHIGANLRQADRIELAASRGADIAPTEAISRAVLLSSHTWVGVADDHEPIAIFGVAPVSLLDGIGSPWFLSTERAHEYPRVFMAEGRRFVAEMQRFYRHLYNYVDERNVRSVRWLRRLGFTVHPAAPYGVAGLPFHKFEIEAQGCPCPAPEAVSCADAGRTAN